MNDDIRYTASNYRFADAEELAPPSDMERAYQRLVENAVKNFLR